MKKLSLSVAIALYALALTGRLGDVDLQNKPSTSHRWEFTTTISERDLLVNLERPANWGNPNVYYHVSSSIQ